MTEHTSTSHTHRSHKHLTSKQKTWRMKRGKGRYRAGGNGITGAVWFLYRVYDAAALEGNSHHRMRAGPRNEKFYCTAFPVFTRVHNG